MGTFVSLFEETEEQQQTKATPDKKTWVTEHVETTGCKFTLSKLKSSNVLKFSSFSLKNSSVDIRGSTCLV